MPRRAKPYCLRLGFLAIVVAALHSGGILRAAEPTAQQAKFFESKIRPLFEANCFQCHSHKKGKSKGHLMLDSLGGLLKGGDSGPAIVPGSPQTSLLAKAISYTDEDLRMPPKGKLAGEQIALLRDWIKMGAPWPGSSSEKIIRRAGTITDADRQWWAFQPVKAYAPPKVADPEWSKNPVDRFIRARLDADGIEPSPPADRAALMRRVSFDLIGLPPSPEEVAAFVADKAPDAYERLVGRLLASPRYGERWARHWLDLVRYAESDGFRQDAYRPNAWRYRDYVIAAFNNDMPYDRFVREQLAGDEIAPDDPQALIATGFLRHTIYEYNNRDARTQWQNMLNDVTDVTADVFLGLGMGCARCHNHKFDPILQKDYYRLQAFFAAMLPQSGPVANKQQRDDFSAQENVWEAKTAPVRARIDELEKSEKAKLRTAMMEKFPHDIQAMINKPKGERAPLETQLAALAYRQVQYEFDHMSLKGTKKKQYDSLEKELAKFDALKPKPLARALTVRDVGTVAPAVHIPKKSVGPAIEPGFLTILDAKPATITPPGALPSTGRRLALANWLTRPENPLTTRVIVNRIWQYHFGRGLVPTASDFGKLGEPPSHPQLLDWLAKRFVADGWSMKKMHRLIVTSMTYRQAALSEGSQAAQSKDPDNRLWWKMTTRRLDAEEIRDAILATTGHLDLAAGGPSVDAKLPRRSIYTKLRRNSPTPILSVFDAPEGFTSMAQRNVTTTPTQALLMFNGPFMVGQAKAFAGRLEREHPADMVDRAYRLAFGRAATTEEIAHADAFLKEQTRRAAGKGADARHAALVDFCGVLLNANEFLYVD